MNSDKTDCGWQLSSIDDTIAESAHEKINMELDNDRKAVKDEKEEEEDIIDAQAALDSLSRSYEWYSTRWEGNSSALLQLEKIREFARDVLINETVAF